MQELFLYADTVFVVGIEKLLTPNCSVSSRVLIGGAATINSQRGVLLDERNFMEQKLRPSLSFVLSPSYNILYSIHLVRSRDSYPNCSFARLYVKELRMESFSCRSANCFKLLQKIISLFKDEAIKSSEKIVSLLDYASKEVLMESLVAVAHVVSKLPQNY